MSSLAQGAQSLSPFSLRGVYGRMYEYAVPTGRTLRREIVRAEVVGGTPYSQRMTLTIYPDILNLNPTNVETVFADIQFGGGQGGVAAAARIGVGRGVSISLPGSFVACQVSVVASAMGPARASYGGLVSLGGIQHNEPIFYSQGIGTIAPAATSSITSFGAFSRSFRIVTRDPRIDNMFIEMLDSAGSVLCAYVQGPGNPIEWQPMLQAMRTLRITNIGAAQIAGGLFHQNIEI